MLQSKKRKQYRFPVTIAQGGGLDVIYDIYTNAGTGEPRYILTSLVDGDAVQNDTAFASLIEA